MALARQGVRIATYGDMLKVPGTVMSLADAQAEGATIDVVYSVTQAVELARRDREPLVFFATGFETTAVATAAAVLDGPPPNFFVLSAHKYIPPVMEIVAEMPETRVEGFPRGRTCGDHHRLGRLRAVRRAPPCPGRRRRLRAARHPRRPGPLVELIRDGQPRGRRTCSRAA